MRDTKGIFFAQILHQVSQNYAKYPVSNPVRVQNISDYCESWNRFGGGSLAFNLVHGVLSRGKLKWTPPLRFTLPQLRLRCKQGPEPGSEIIPYFLLVSHLFTGLWLVGGGSGIFLWSDAGQLEQKKGNLFLLHWNKSFEGRQFPDTANNISSTRLLKSISNKLKYITLVPQNNFQFDSSRSSIALSTPCCIWGWLQS